MTYVNDALAGTAEQRLEGLNAEIDHHVKRLEYHRNREKALQGGIRYHINELETLMQYRFHVMAEMEAS